MYICTAVYWYDIIIDIDVIILILLISKKFDYGNGNTVPVEGWQ